MLEFPTWRNLTIAVMSASKEVAAIDMRVLNSYTKTVLCSRDTKEKIYFAKDVFIEWLCRTGYQVNAYSQIQTIQCNNISHMFSDEGAECEDCNGTGVFKQHRLYVYDFRMGELSWGWHQPQERAITKPTLTNLQVGKFDPGNRSMPLEFGDIQQRYWNVCIFLMLRGMNQITKMMIKDAVRNVKFNLLNQRARILNKILMVTQDVLQKILSPIIDNNEKISIGLIPKDDEFPF